MNFFDDRVMAVGFVDGYRIGVGVGGEDRAVTPFVEHAGLVGVGDPPRRVWRFSLLGTRGLNDGFTEVRQ